MQSELIKKSRKPWLAGVLSSIIPGVGHVYLGNFDRGVKFYATIILIYCLLLISGILPFPIFSLAFLLICFTIVYVYSIVDSVKLTRLIKSPYFLKPYNKWYIYFGAYLIIFYIVLPIAPKITKKMVVQSYTISSGAMKSTLFIGDHFFVNKYSYLFSQPKRGDIVLFPFPEDPSKELIFRVIGLSGDKIEIREKKLFINDRFYPEEYISNRDPDIIPLIVKPRDFYGPVIVPKDSLFLMGDNRDHSWDSRFWGFVKASSVKGKPENIYWSWDRNASSVIWNRIGKHIS